MIVILLVFFALLAGLVAVFFYSVRVEARSANRKMWEDNPGMDDFYKE